MLTKARERLHNQLAALMAMDRVVNQDGFERLFKSVSPSLQTEALNYIAAGEYQLLRTWIKTHENREPNTNELKDMAMVHGVKNYSRMSKEDLIYVLTRRLGISSSDLLRTSANGVT